MNASLWQLAGWTMIHSLWLGAAVALAGGFLRLACRRATPNTRYAISLATLALLAATPIATAAWLSVNGVPQLAATSPSPRYSGERLGEGQNDQGTWPSRNAGATNENPFLSPPLPGTDLSDLQSSTSQIIDLANPNSSPQPSGTWSGEGFAALPATPHAKVTIGNPSPTSSLPPSALPLHPSDHQSPITSHLSTLIPYLPTLWLIGAPLTFTLLATGLVGSERLRRRATPLTAGPAYDACQRLRQTLTITRRVALAVCDDVAQPILVGIVRPLILLPTAALAGWTPEQLDMVLLHELAHVRRWDNLVNLLQRIVESLLFFHPAVWLVSRQVRRDREECCDAAVIRHTDRPEAYATLLIDIASRLRLSGSLSPTQSLTVASAMASHPLAGRIRRILNIEAEPMRITRRTLAATLLLPLLLAAALFYSGANAEDAQNPPLPQKQPSTVASDDRAQGGSNPNNSTATDSAAPDDDPVYRMTYGLDSFPSNVDLRQWMEIIASDPRIEIQWQPKEKRLVLSAPESRHQELSDLFKSARDVTPAEGDYRTPGEITQLQNEIRNLEDLIAKAQKELVDIEASNELMVQNSNNPATIDAAIASELDKDPTIQQQKQQLLDLNSTLQAKLSASKNPDDADIKRLRASMQEAEAELAKHRSEAESTLREKIAKMPNETLRAALTEYKIRRKSAEENLAKYKQDLEAARTKLSQLAPTLPAPVQQPSVPPSTYRPGTFPTIQEFPADADMQEVNAVVDKLTAEGRQVAIEKNVDGRQRIVDTAARASNSWNDGKANVANNAAILFDANPNDKSQEITVGFPSGFPDSDQERERIRKAIEAEGFKATLSAPLDESGSLLGPHVLRVDVPRDWNAKPVWEERSGPDGTTQKTLRLIDEKMVPLPPGALVQPAGAPNQGTAAAGSNAWNTQPAANASPDSAPLTQKPETPANAPAASYASNSDRVTEREAWKLRRLFKESDSNERITKFYAVPRESRQELETAIGVEASNLFGAYRPPFHLEWKPGEDAVYVTASSLAHRGYFRVVFAANALGQFGYPPDPQLPAYQAALQEMDEAQADAARALEGLPPTQSPASPFPTLENQKIADRAYKLLGLELEPLTPAEVERVKKLGYNGGLRVIAIDPNKQEALGPNNLLVGLHVWPITDLQSLDAVLTREDLDDLSPLRFRTVVKASDSPLKQPEDRVISGRMPIDVEAFRSIQRSLPLNHANAATVPTAYLSPYLGRDVNIASTTSDYEHPDAFLRALQRSRESDKPVVVHLLAHNSDPSDEFAKTILGNPEVADFLDKKFDAITIYADDEPAFAKAFHVNRVPADMFIFVGGERMTGGITLPATPELYLAHLKFHYKLATTPALQNGDAPLVPAAPIAPAADRPDGDNQAFERPPSHVEGVKLVKEFPATINPDELRAVVEGYRQEGNDVWVERLPESNAIRVLVASKAAAAQPPAQQPTFLYDGKTFDQWRDLWKLELNPERRTEAVNALAAFGRTGRGDEAISAILDVAAEYDFSRIDDSKPEGRLKERVIEALAPEDVTNAEDQWLPLLLSRLKSDPPKWDPLLIQLLARTGPPYRASFVLTPDNLKLLKQAAADPAYGPNARLVNHLYWSAPEDKEVAQLVKATLTGADAANAVELLRNIGYRRIDEYPEKLELLFHSDPAIRRLARTALYHSIDPGTHDAVTAKLLAIVADPKQADRHADAIRAIAAIVKRAGDKPNPGRPTLSKETIQAIADGLTPILAEGSAELIPPAFLVADKVRRTANFKNKLVDFLSNPPEDRMAPVEAALKASPDEESALIDQPEHGGGVDGSGGGFF